MLRKCGLVFALCAVLTAPAAAQQITKFAVIDTSRVYTTFFRDAQNVREYERKKTEYKNAVDKLTAEVQSLMQEKVDAEQQGDSVKAIRLEGQITNKSNYLIEYANVKNAELAAMKKKLASDDSFYKLLYAEIERIAESDGYSMVLSLQNSESVVWYSPSVDITDAVIARLSKSARN